MTNNKKSSKNGDEIAVKGITFILKEMKVMKAQIAELQQNQRTNSSSNSSIPQTPVKMIGKEKVMANDSPSASMIAEIETDPAWGKYALSGPKYDPETHAAI